MTRTMTARYIAPGEYEVTIMGDDRQVSIARITQNSVEGDNDVETIDFESNEFHRRIMMGEITVAEIVAAIRSCEPSGKV